MKKEPKEWPSRDRSKWWLKTAGVLVLLVVLSLGVSQVIIMRSAEGRIATDVEMIPERKVALVLGCSPYLKGRTKNPFFENRMDAAASLWRSGRVQRLLLSGDNRKADYNEPQEMKRALALRGVPADAVVLDFAGLRTLDSVVRAKQVFGQTRLVIISQRDHLQRALFIAGAANVEAIGYAAADVGFKTGLRTALREVVARLAAVVDVYLLQRAPRHLGPKIEISSQDTKKRTRHG